MKTPSLWMIAAVCFVAPASVAHARSAYDGSWDLVFVTQRGSCDPSYNFTVNVYDGIVTHPNLVKFRGYVAKSGSVHASVTVHDKFASGTGRLFGTSGRGNWSGPRGKCAMLGLLDRAAQLTNLKREAPCPEPLTCEAALKTTALAATLLFAHGQTTERTVAGAERLGRALSAAECANYFANAGCDHT
jgi:hypothetical protein